MLRFRSRYGPSHEPRVEMTPLLDVIFLLLTFFIYSIVVSVRAQVLPVTFPEMTTGQTPADVRIAGVTVDRRGRFFLNREPVTREELETRIKALAGSEDPPVFYLAIDAGDGEVDRAPLLLGVFEMFQRLKVDVNLVGAPRGAPAR